MNNESQRFLQRIEVESLGVYLKSRSGHIGIFIIVNHLLKFQLLKPLKKQLSNFCKNIFFIFGIRETTVSDYDLQLL